MELSLVYSLDVSFANLKLFLFRNVVDFSFCNSLGSF